ncbi:hypothetical protein TSUD_373530 [Trifolium subterraneum]|uniref:Uncharacterized protein n=1 Tax=Trifolium subterraneum TaxID=3900 RepID=A0A2Z6ML21_TRISU|nr:hypothetical protein TSUD_373530 [Trifolium subterraneum]
MPYICTLELCKSELNRLNFQDDELRAITVLDYSFLDFQGTVMCQKRLSRNTSPESEVTRGS